METESSKDLSPQQKYSLLLGIVRKTKKLTHSGLSGLGLIAPKEGRPLTDQDFLTNIEILKEKLK